MSSATFSSRKQRGSALIVALSILLVLTILGVSAMRTTSLEEKMAGNARDTQTAFEAAEAALHAAEIYLTTTIGIADFNAGGLTGYFTARGLNPESWKTETNWTNAVQIPAYDAAQISQPPRYMIQIVDSDLVSGKSPEAGKPYGGPQVRDIEVFQITARGFGISPNSRVMLQTYFGRIQ